MNSKLNGKSNSRLNSGLTNSERGRMLARVGGSAVLALTALLGLAPAHAVAHAMSIEGCVEAPSNVFASQTQDCGPVEVIWDSNGGDNFRVMRFPIEVPGGVEEAGQGTSPFYDYNGSVGVEYVYWVVAIAECGESDPSPTDNGGRGFGGILAPGWVSATDNQYCDLIVVEWDTNSGGSYDLYRSESPDFFAANLLTSFTSPPYYDNAVAGNVGYYYWVVANTDCGASQPGGPDVGYSNFGLYITGNPSDAYVEEGSSAGFSVSVSGFGAYQWFRNGEALYDGGAISGATSSGLSISPVYFSDEADYYCEVYGGCGSQTSSSAHLYVTQRPCYAPAWLTASDAEGCAEIIVDWDTSTGAYSYDLYRSEQSDVSTASYIGNFASPAHRDTAVAGNVTYYYWVYGNLDCGRSPPFGPETGSTNEALYISEHPTDLTVFVNAPAQFSISIVGFGGFQWFRDGLYLTEDGNISGTQSDTLSIASASYAEAGGYYCLVYGGCGTLTSNVAILTVQPCPADFNQDGGVDGTDVDVFFEAWTAADSATDIDLSGGVDGADVDAFFLYWSAGGC